MLSVLIEGAPVGEPARRIGRNGAAYCTARVRCADESGESIPCSVVAFGVTAAKALEALQAGDAGPWPGIQQSRAGKRTAPTTRGCASRQRRS